MLVQRQTAVVASTVVELPVIAVVHTSSWGLAYDQALTGGVARMIERNDFAEAGMSHQVFRSSRQRPFVEESS